MMNSKALPLRSSWRSVVPGIAFCLVLFALSTEAADVIVVGDTQLKPVAEIVSGIRGTINASVPVYAFSDVKGKLKTVAARESAMVVIALGKDAIEEAVHLPPSTAVIYDLVIIPPAVSRPNMTGTFMATPVSEYITLINRYLPSLKRTSAVSGQNVLRILASDQPHVSVFPVSNSFELVKTIRQLDQTDALLLLPDISLLTATAVDEIYLFSFRKKIPILGISERHVKQGALFALVFDPVHVGRQLGELAIKSLSGEDIGKISPAPSRRYDLYVNSDTADKMGIALPGEMIKTAKKVYP
jgi:hypothetical protein